MTKIHTQYVRKKCHLQNTYKRPSLFYEKNIGNIHSSFIN